MCCCDGGLWIVRAQNLGTEKAWEWQCSSERSREQFRTIWGRHTWKCGFRGKKGQKVHPNFAPNITMEFPLPCFLRPWKMYITKVNEFETKSRGIDLPFRVLQGGGRQRGQWLYFSFSSAPDLFFKASMRVPFRIATPPLWGAPCEAPLDLPSQQWVQTRRPSFSFAIVSVRVGTRKRQRTLTAYSSKSFCACQGLYFLCISLGSRSHGHEAPSWPCT